MSDIDDIIKYQQIKRRETQKERADEVKREKAGIVGPKNPFAGQTIENFPMHLEPPRGCETFDISENLTLTDPDVEVTLIDWVIPDGVVGFWRAYSLYTNTPAGVTAEWKFRLNGNPVFKYHGSSINDFKKTLALSNDLSNLVDALQELKAGDHIEIIGSVSSSVIPCNIAARIKGWLITDRIPLSRVGS